MAVESISSPETLTTGLALLLVGTYAILGYVAIRLQSAISIVGWGMSFISLLLVILVGIGFRYVWITMIFVIVLEMISSIIYVSFGSKA